MASSKKVAAPPSFEEAIQELDEITRALESGSLSLEKSIEAYERGMELRAICLQLLEQAERKLEIVEKSHDGQLKRVPFGSEAQGDDSLFGQAGAANQDPLEPPF